MWYEHIMTVIGKVHLSELKLVTDNLLSIYAAVNWEATEELYVHQPFEEEKHTWEAKTILWAAMTRSHSDVLFLKTKY